MSDLKQALIRLGTANPDLRKNLKPVIAHLDKQAYPENQRTYRELADEGEVGMAVRKVWDAAERAMPVKVLRSTSDLGTKTIEIWLSYRKPMRGYSQKAMGQAWGMAEDLEKALRGKIPPLLRLKSVEGEARVGAIIIKLTRAEPA